MEGTPARRGAHVCARALGQRDAAVWRGGPPAGAGGPALVRSVPFTTRRPTFSEAKRVLAALLTVQPAELPQAPGVDPCM